MKRNHKSWKLLSICLLVCLAVSGCGKPVETMQSETEETASSTEGTTEMVLPTSHDEYRKVLEELPAVQEPAKNPGTREHFSFVENDKTYVFTETENLWLYSQSLTGTLKTTFVLNEKDYKVVISIPEQEKLAEWKPEEYTSVYKDDSVEIYRQEDTEEVSEEEPMYVSVLDLTYEVTGWQELVNKKVLSLSQLYEDLAQLGTAIVPAEEKETVSDVLTAMGAVPVFEDYCIAFREDVAYSGYIFCSPNKGNLDYDDVNILLSFVIPEWKDYATICIEDIPDYQDRLEDTGESFDGHPILADYNGELKYFLIGEDGKCIYLYGVPKNTEGYANNFSAKEAAYIFEVVLTK